MQRPTAAQPPPARRTHPRAGQRRVLWCVLLALAFYGLLATRVALLGSNHVHSRVADADPVALVLQDFRRTDHLSDATLQSGLHVHSHAKPQRHRHDRGDTTVESFDAVATDDLSGGDAASAALAVLILGALTTLLLPRPQGTALRWALTGRQPLCNGYADRLERPPRA